MPQATGKVIAGCFALTAFAVAVVAGLIADNPMLDILARSAIAMCICYPLGFLVGLIVEHVIAQHMREFVDANPVPDSSALDAVGGGGAPSARSRSAGKRASAGGVQASEEILEA
ncbi:MAG: hypothetical protein KC983_11205 [Phycisphaerales bacterium]|nr:hypothetical protein [Phycisphaerales bacterium]